MSTDVAEGDKERSGAARVRTAADPALPQCVVGRVLTLLTAFRPGDTELTLAELHRRTGIAKPTAHRLLAELDGWDVIERPPTKRRSPSRRCRR